MPDAVFGLVAILAEGDECGQPVRAGSLPMMRAQAIPCATSLAGKIVPHFGPQHPFVNVERLPAAWTTTRDADSIHVKMPGWTSLAHRIVLVRELAVTQVRVRKSPDALVPVAGANQFDPRRKPLMYGEGVPPSCSMAVHRVLPWIIRVFWRIRVWGRLPLCFLSSQRR
jgi:hypothetical protein